MINTVVSTLLHRLEAGIGSADYQLLLPLHQLRKETGSGFHSIIIAAGPATPTLAELHLGIRIDVVEDLVYQFTSGLAGYGPHSTTLIASAGRVQGVPYWRYELSKPDDCAAVARQMSEFLEAAGFLFLQKYQRIEALDALFNGEPQQKLLLLPNLLHRSLRGVVLAKLTQRSRWEQLVGSYRDQLMRRGTPEPMMKRYALLTHHLRNFSVNEWSAACGLIFKQVGTAGLRAGHRLLKAPGFYVGLVA